jgi:F0F1-type ATP synthase assembly protein I
MIGTILLFVIAGFLLDNYLHLHKHIFAAIFAVPGVCLSVFNAIRSLLKKK